jgi:hypothetical protein
MEPTMNTRKIMLCVLSIALLTGLTVPTVAVAQEGATEEEPNDEEARVHFRLGTAYYESGRFREAAREYQQAYDLSPRPTLLYNLFLAWRDASELEPAVDALRRYLAEGNPPSDTRIRLEAQLQGMEQRLEQQRAAAATTGTTTAATTATTTETSTTESGTETTEAGDDTSSTTTDTSEDDDGAESVADEDSGGGGVPLVPIIVMSAGGALAIASIITGVMALGKQGELDDMCDADGACAPGFEDARDSGQSLAIVTDVLLFGGLATIAVGAVLLALGVGGGDDEEDPSVAFGCTGDGCAASARVPF